MNKALQTMEWMTPGANLNAYIQGTATVPILSLDEEKSLGEALYYEDDLDAARKLVMSHLRFVVHIARSYNGYGLPLADLIQEGNVGLMKAVRRFNPEKGVRVVSFAVHWIKAEIHEFILRNWRIVKIATTKSQRKLFFNLRSAKKELQWLSADEAKAVAEDLGVEVKDVMEMEMRLTSRDATFDAPADDDEDSVAYSPSLYLESKGADPAELIENDDFEDDNNSRLAEAVNSLDDRSQSILQRRWLDDKKATLHQLADEYGVSAERIRQLEKNAMKKVRLLMEA
ncbi:RNA polymerase sigma factor RpoH [Porticoccaceae bacterium]|jgi:RNA polymerase sigma-32 factor|nr:RNA polymerase sigma factor RpoH [Porticoccaceae bacterium]MDA7589259.1 RNA polymerase sigma factor RpoH [Porticoccaceae bacterium]MDA7769120.1 RNA polymerase sigma factor RpoH [Porticoccaceae bacterium]MDB2395158.1 RNA polymerase sigma factor RpoH [Porticoccaceae bacterium]|tara:strand:+ start:140 stop:994 length:855 start_codon:yes stop_codon:yes gene_type:complete